MEEKSELGVLTGPFHIPLGPARNGAWKHYFHVSDKSRGKKIVDYRVHIEILLEGEIRHVIGFDPADDGPHCDEYRLDGETQKWYLSFGFDAVTGYKDALEDADEKVSLNHREYIENFKQGRWPCD